MIQKRRTLACAAIATAAILATGTAWSQDYPTKPIALVVPFAAGGPTDILARAISVPMGKALGTPVIVDNKPGAGGTISATLVAKAAPNGYTFLIHHNGMATAPALYRKLKYDPLTDFEYVGQVADVPMTLIGRKDLPANNFPELLKWLKENRDKVNLAHAGLGAVSHLCGLMFRQAVGVDLTTVPYQGTAPAMVAILGSQVDLLCDQTTQTLSHIKSGAVKVFAVTVPKRLASLPDTPTLDEAGLKGFEVKVWHGIYAPKGTPPAVIQKVNAALREALKDPNTVRRMTELGVDIVPESKQTPESLHSWLKEETERWGPVIRNAGVYAD